LQFDSSKTMHVTVDWIHPCKGLYNAWHPTTSVESEVYTAYRWRICRGREFNTL